MKTKYPSFDERTLSLLDEELKAGLYEAKNMGLMPIGHAKRQIQGLDQGSTLNKAELKVKLLRETLIQIKESFEAVTEKR